MGIVEMSMMGGVMVLVIAIVRSVLFHRLPKKTFICLWELAMLRFVLSLSVPSEMSIYNLFAKQKPWGSVKTVVGIDPVRAVTTYNTDKTVAQDAVRFTAAATPAGASVSIWCIVWIIGMVAVFSVFVAGYVSIWRKYRYAAVARNCYAAEWISGQKMKRKVRICLSEEASSPFTYGIFRPVVILPEQIETEKTEQLSYILAHEMIHVRQFDALRKMAAAAVVCIHWFNPAAWILFFLYNRDIEHACDETVVREAGKDIRSAYALALIGMEESRLSIPSLPSYFGKNFIEERIVAIMKIKKITFLTAIAVCVLVAGVTVALTTSAAGTAGEELSGDDPQDALAAAPVHEVLPSKEEKREEIEDVRGLFAAKDWNEVEKIPFTGAIDLRGVVCLGEVPEADIRIYGYNDDEIKLQGVAVDRKGDVQFFDWVYSSGYLTMPRIYWNKGKNQLQMACQTYEGNGRMADNLHVLQYDDRGLAAVGNYSDQEYVADIEKRITARQDPDSRVLAFYDHADPSGDGVRAVFSTDEITDTVEEVSFTYDSGFALGDEILLNLMPMCRMKGSLDYDFDVVLPPIDVVVNVGGIVEDGLVGFELGKLTVWPEWRLKHYIKARKQ